MSDRHDDGNGLREIWSRSAPAGAGPGCPPDDEIWRAVQGQLPAEQAARLLAHSRECPACATSFAMAGEIGRQTGAIPGRAAREARPRRGRLFWTLGTLAAAAALLLVISPLLLRGPAGPPPAGGDLAARVTTSLWRVGAAGDETLATGARVRPGDRLYLTIDSEAPVNLYVLDRDQQGEVSVLFPVEGAQWSNPIPPGSARRIPGETTWDYDSWEISSAGGEENLIVVASLEPLDGLQRALSRIDPAVPSPPGGPLRGEGPNGPGAGVPDEEAAAALERVLSDLRASPVRGRGLLLEEFRLENPK